MASVASTCSQTSYSTLIKQSYHMLQQSAETCTDHYELLLRSLALNNQCYVVGCAPARNESASYVTWSNSTIVNPWGTVVANLGHEVKVKSVSLDITSVDTVRKCIPIKDEFVY